MAVSPSTYYLEGINHTRVAVTREGLKHLFNQAEAELHRSEVYQQAIDNLCQGLGETTTRVYQTLVQTVGREAIRVALRQLLRQYRVLPPDAPEETITVNSAPEAPSIPSSPSDSSTLCTETAIASPPVSAITPAPTTLPVHRPDPVIPKSTTSTTRANARPSVPTEAQRRRQMAFADIGSAIAQARTAAGLSLEELHYKTWVPLHQLRALEKGDPDHLPEDIYVRGFIRRVAGVVKLDVETILASLSTVDVERSVIPSWHDSIPAYRQIQPMHLYVGYAALMAGAAGGLAWVSQQPISNQLVNQHFPDLWPDAAVESTPRQSEFTVSPADTLEGVIANPEIAPPEGFPF